MPILPSRVFDNTAAFWAKLGFREVARYPGYLILKRRGIEFHFFESPELDPSENNAGTYVQVTDSDALHQECLALGLPDEGIPRLTPIKDESWGMREFSLIDPDGSLYRFGTPLPDQS